jgi:hypothetical protein
LALAYDAAIRAETAPMSAWAAAAATILQGLVSAESPAAGASLGGSLTYLYNQMIAQSASVQEGTVTVSATAFSDNVGGGRAWMTAMRGDGLVQQNTVAEAGVLAITSDSFTGGATAGQEPWSWAGSPNVSSLGTGTPVGIWDWDYPAGSGAAASGRAVSSSQYNSTAGNFLTNGDFAGWTTGGTPILNNWHLAAGTWGSSIQQASGGISGGFCVRFNAGAASTLTQQFGGNLADGTNVAAGTAAAVRPLTVYAVSVWLKATGVISAGTLTVSLTDGGGTVINNQAGNASSGTVTLSTVGSSAWVNFVFFFALPAVTPVVVRLTIGVDSALAGANLLMAASVFAVPASCYPGGPGLVVFSDPASPFEAVPAADGFDTAATNNRGGASFLATFQSLVNRLFGAPLFLLPYSGSPTISDTLITGA